MKLVTVIKGEGQAPDNYSVPDVAPQLLAVALSHTYGEQVRQTNKEGTVFVLTGTKVELPKEPVVYRKHPLDEAEQKIGELTEINRQLTDALMQIAGLTKHYFNSPLHAKTPEIFVANDANIIANEVLKRLRLGGI